MTTQSFTSTATRPLHHQLGLGAILGPLLFTLAWIILGIAQPPIHNIYGVMGGVSGAISNPISGLGVGPQATLFNAAFIVCGLLTAVGTIAAAAALLAHRGAFGRWSCALLLALSPIGLAFAGVFTLADSIVLHSVAALFLFGSPLISFVVAGLMLRNRPGLRRFGNALILAGPLTLALFVAYALSFDQARVAAGEGIAGLTERILILELQFWYVALGWLALRQR